MRHLQALYQLADEYNLEVITQKVKTELNQSIQSDDHAFGLLEIAKNINNEESSKVFQKSMEYIANHLDSFKEMIHSIKTSSFPF